MTGRRSDRGQRGTHVVRQSAQLSGPPGELGTLSRVRQFTVNQEMPDVLETAGLREFDGRVLAVVVEALHPLTSPNSVSVTTTPASPRGTSTEVIAALLINMFPPWT